MFLIFGERFWSRPGGRGVEDQGGSGEWGGSGKLKKEARHKLKFKGINMVN